ncbi:MAG: fumarylacetoacetate hydrolase family protein [Chloroflexi bacterium]|nr:fumarylacetoacetate hydrolase family protein [Chloroflexota bacterium]
MKLTTFSSDGQPRLGAVAGDLVIDLHASRPAIPDNMRAFLEAGDPAWDAARELSQLAAQGKGSDLSTYPAGDVRFHTPIPNPSKVIAVGLNYRDHCREQGVEPPPHPILFAKFPTAVTGPNEVIRWSPSLTSQVDYEAELAFVVGKRAYRVPVEEAWDYVFGYTAANDISARDLQFGDKQWVRGKSLDTFCPLGPVLVSRDEITNPHALAIRAILNGETMQDSSTGEMIFSVADLLSFISQAMTLNPGDVVLTGTPPGVGVFREPQRFLRDGDEISIEIEGIGRLTNRCAEM